MVLTYLVVDTIVSKMCTGFLSETTTKYTFCPKRSSCFLGFLAVCVDSASFCLALALHFSTRVGCTPDRLSPGLRGTETGPDIENVYVSLCIHFLPQPSLHLAVLLFKNTVSCGLLTSILAGLHLAPDQQAVAHFCMNVGGFLLHFSMSLSLFFLENW